MDTAQLKKKYKEEIAPALQKQFNYSSAMQIPVLKKIYRCHGDSPSRAHV